MHRAFYEYLRGFRGRTAETIRAEIVNIRADGNYKCRNSRTGGEFIASQGAFGSSLQPGQVVTTNRPDASLRSSGSEHGIIAVQTTNTRNNSLASRFTDQRSAVGESLAIIKSGGVIVSSVQLVKGGAAVTVVIYGNGLTSSATYGNAGITDNVAQVITSTLITIQVKASGGMAIGTYSLTVAGVTIPNFFSVIA